MGHTAIFGGQYWGFHVGDLMHPPTLFPHFCCDFVLEVRQTDSLSLCSQHGSKNSKEKFFFIQEVTCVVWLISPQEGENGRCLCKKTKTKQKSNKPAATASALASCCYFGLFFFFFIKSATCPASAWLLHYGCTVLALIRCLYFYISLLDLFYIVLNSK